MRRGTAAALLGASIVAGVAAGVGASWLGEDGSAKGWPTIAAPVPEATGVEVKDPVLVANDDGGATLSATLVNHTDDALTISSATGGLADDHDAPTMLVYGIRSDASLAPEGSIRIGGVGDDFRLRFTSRVQVGSTLPITIIFQGEGAYVPDAPSLTTNASVVARTARHADVADNGPNDAISVEDAAIVVVPGQEKAYVAGRLRSTITDVAYDLPTAVGPRGQTIEYRHQTATGGPYGIMAAPGKDVDLGSPPYLDTEPHGDADYFRASDVTVGDRITVTMRFPSGDVVTKFKVVQVRSDGTI